MKKAFLLIAFVTFSLQAQTVFQLQVVNIDPLDTDQFEMVEKKFAQPLAQEAKEREIRLAQDQRRSHLTRLKRTKTSELAKASSEVIRLERERDNAHHIMMDQYKVKFTTETRVLEI